MSSLEDTLRALFIRLGHPILIASILILLGCFAARADVLEEVDALNGQFNELYGKGKYARRLALASGLSHLRRRRWGRSIPTRLQALTILPRSIMRRVGMGMACSHELTPN